MARKSAARVKAMNLNNHKDYLKQELPPIEETFENIKQVIVNTAEVAVIQAGRVNNLMNLREAAYRFWGNMLDDKYTMVERMKYLKDLQAKTVAVYEDVLDIVKTFELEEFLKEDMKDYFLVLTPQVIDIETEEDLFEAHLVSDIIKPWGEKMTQLHHQMLDEQGQRKAMEEE